MIPGNAILNAIAEALAADPSTIAPLLNPPKLGLVKTAFVPGPNLAITDYTLADFVTSTPIGAIAGAQNSGINPVTLERIVEMKIPAGGWRWVVTSTTNLPQTIYGAVLYDNGGTTVYGAVLFNAPILLDAVGQVCEVDAVQFAFLINGIQ